MDESTRPKRAAKRRFGSRSLSFSTVRDDDQDTEEYGLPILAQGDESAPEDGSEGNSEATEPGSEEPTATRRPDPRASRRSIRKEAQKNVNYNTKHHPQDRSIPGFEQKARQLRRSRGPMSIGKGAKKKCRVDQSCEVRLSRSPSLRLTSDVINTDELVEEALRNIGYISTSSALETTKTAEQEESILISDNSTPSSLDEDQRNDLPRLENFLHLDHETLEPNAPSTPSSTTNDNDAADRGLFEEHDVTRPEKQPLAEPDVADNRVEAEDQDTRETIMYENQQEDSRLDGCSIANSSTSSDTL